VGEERVSVLELMLKESWGEEKLSVFLRTVYIKISNQVKGKRRQKRVVDR